MAFSLEASDLDATWLVVVTLMALSIAALLWALWSD
jgi:hypothetical protein